MKKGNFQSGWGWATFLTILGFGALLFQVLFLPYSPLSQIIIEALRLGWMGGLAFLGFFLWIHIGRIIPSTRHQLKIKGLVAFLAYSLFLLAIANYKIHFFQKTGLLPISLVLLTVLTFFLATYFGKARPLLRVSGTMILLTAAMSGFGNWLPQVEGGFPTPTYKVDVYSMTPQQLADEGEKIIFGGLGQSNVQGAIGRGQCPLCHGFKQGYLSHRAPNLWGITVRKRLHDTPIEYIAESHTCPSCYVVGGFGVKGTENRESPMPRIHKPPISLSIEELIAIDTWLFVREGEIPPAPETIEAAYRKFIPESDIIKKNTPFDPNDEDYPNYNLAKVDVTGEEPIEEIFIRSKCFNCHIVPGINLPQNTVGPKLVMKTNSPARLADPNYTGNATTVREYINESILTPNTYVTEGFRSGSMPKDYGIKISALALNKMVDYLATQEEGKNE